jgi:hypothetical protein
VIGVALKGLAGRKFRAVLTSLAIVLGVAMISGAYVLTDTIDKAFDAIFVDSYAGTDAVVSGREVGISFEGRERGDAAGFGVAGRDGARGRRHRGGRRYRLRRPCKVDQA